ncbi:MAG: DoxX family membrane protein [Albidovulum sp.]
MKNLLSTYDRLANGLSRLGLDATPLLARFTFAAVLLVYFWNSALTKIGDGIFGFLHPTDGAYIQIFPKAFEAAGYDSSQLGFFHWAVATAGTLAELILPLLIIIGLFTRLAALGMIGFTLVQSLTDVYGHMVGGDDLGRWFDGASGALVLDQRSLWVLLFATLVLLGSGPLSLDRWLAKGR